MVERDPDFFKLHYRQWRRRMHKLGVPYDIQGALLCIVVETHLGGSPPPDNLNVLAGVMSAPPRKVVWILKKLLAFGLVEIVDGLVVDKTAVADTKTRRDMRADKAAAGHLGGVRSGEVRKAQREGNIDLSPIDKSMLGEGCDGFASPNPLGDNETGEALAKHLVELEERRVTEKKEALVRASKERRGARLDPDWNLPEKWRDFSLSLGMNDDDIDHEAAQFRDWWVAKPGAGGVKLDWKATWQVWCRKSVKDAAPRRRSNSGGKADERFNRQMEMARSRDQRRAALRGVADSESAVPTRPLLPDR